MNGTEIFYKTYSQGHPLLLLHGGTLTGDLWEPYIAALSEHFRLIVPDTPGHGKSGTPDADLTYPGLADDMAAFIEALELHQPLVAGYSDGGQIALEIGMRHPALTRRPRCRRRLLPLQPLLQRLAQGVFGEDPAREMDIANFERSHPDWAEWLRHLYGPDAWPSVLARVRPMWTTPFDYSRDELARIVAPRWSFSETATRSSRSRKRRNFTADCPRPNWPSSRTPTMAPSLRPRSTFSRRSCWTSFAATGRPREDMDRNCPRPEPAAGLERRAQSREATFSQFTSFSRKLVR